MLSVVKCVHNLGGAVQKSVPEFKGPTLGVADKSRTKGDFKRSLGIATVRGGLQCSMDRFPAACGGRARGSRFLDVWAALGLWGSPEAARGTSGYTLGTSEGLQGPPVSSEVFFGQEEERL